jgi:hypothetical protein
MKFVTVSPAGRRRYLDILARYRKIASQLADTDKQRRPLLLRTYEGLRWTAAETTWHTKYGVKNLGKRVSKGIKNSISGRRAA